MAHRANVLSWCGVWCAVQICHECCHFGVRLVSIWSEDATSVLVDTVPNPPGGR
ncbi:hypothetical protein BC826DRAFT_1031238, partial [Russula brevipes]